jgi:hypothetical protein
MRNILTSHFVADGDNIASVRYRFNLVMMPQHGKKIDCESAKYQ